MRIRQHLLFVLILVFSLFTLLACGGSETPALQEAPRAIVLTTDNSPISTPNASVSILPTPIPFIFPENVDEIQPAAGKAIVYGRLMSSITGQPITNAPVRMAEIFYAEGANKDPNQGAWALDNAFSPFAYSNDDGYFIFKDVEPTGFVIFVGDVIDRYNVETNENERPIPREAPADTKSNLGDVVVGY